MIYSSLHRKMLELLDIDKSYLMGLSLDGNGCYVGWSSLFDYSSLEALRASEDLPMPRLGEFKKTDDGVNIDTYVQQIKEALNNVLKVRLYAQLLNDLYRLLTFNVNYSDDETGRVVLSKLNLHEKTTLPTGLIEDAFKNFISSHIQTVIQDPANMIKAYSPIEMDDFEGAADAVSSKGKYAKITLYNPATKFYMQFQNVLGKNTVGIGANGEKGCFMWHYYLTDILKHYSEDPEKMAYAAFSFTSSRVMDISKGLPREVTLNMLPDIDLSQINPEAVLTYANIFDGEIHQLRPSVPASSIVSQFISAATDNAKVLILPRVNAGSKLAKIYLFMMTLGFEVNDIVRFMTSPVVSFIDNLTEGNIFNGDYIRMKDALKIAYGNFEYFFEGISFDSLPTLDGKVLKNDVSREEFLEMCYLGNVENLVNPFEKHYESYSYTEFEDAIRRVKLLKAIRGYSNPDDIRADLLEFENLNRAASEFSTFTQILGINQGIPTDKITLNKVVARLKKLYAENSDDEEEFDLIKFFSDPEYARTIKQNYKKTCVNVFDVIDHIPQFRQAFNLMSAVIQIDENLVLKSAIYNQAYDRLKSSYPYMTDRFLLNLLSRGINSVFVRMFLNTKDISIPIKAGWNSLLSDGSFLKAAKDGNIKLQSTSNLATFKYLFEHVIIPKLKSGIIVDYDASEGRVYEHYVPDIQSNPFIQSLIRSNEFDMPIYRCNINMRTIEESNDSRIRFELYVRGLKELSQYNMNGMPLADWFALYNLVVHQNQHGDSRFTTLFESFIRNSKASSLILDYLSFVGSFDYNSTVSRDGDAIAITYDKGGLHITETVLIDDLMRAAAVTIGSVRKNSDPMVIVNTADGPQYYRGTEPAGYVVLRKVGEDSVDYQERIVNNKAYFTLGSLVKDLIDSRLTNLLSGNISLMISAIRSFLRNSQLMIQKICQ